MAGWRALRGWDEAELERALDSLRGCPRSFDPVEIAGEPERWRRERFDAVVAREQVGPASETFHRARAALTSYRFSDPSIVEGHFDASAPLLGRRMLLEVKVLGLHFLSGVMVTEVLDEAGPDETAFGFRYDTLEGHIERGWEWFRLRKDHASGVVRFSVRSRWQNGQFPNWWSRAGFVLLAGVYRARWLRHAAARIERAAREPEPEPSEVALAGEPT